MCGYQSQPYSVDVSFGVCRLYKDGVLGISIPVHEMLKLFREMRRQHRAEKAAQKERLVQWEANRKWANTPEELAAQWPSRYLATDIDLGAII
jgi:hypothetical protein